MKSISTIGALYESHPRIVAALGTFDGVHKGHQKIIRRAVEMARARGGTSVVFSFQNHPLSLIAPERCPAQLTTAGEKERLLAELGVDVWFNPPFTMELLKLPPRGFPAFLYEHLRPECVVTGPNYSFGHHGAGTPEMLEQWGAQYHFAVEVQPVVYAGGQMISSTLIRKLVARGKVAAATKLLGRPVSLRGTVVGGERRGRQLGFPTANLKLDPAVAAPGDGVYAVRAGVDGGPWRNAVANIGSNPTFRDRTRHLETHILDFAGDLYGRVLTVHFIEKIREQQTFAGVAELVARIRLDVAQAQKIL